jgi:hypothetical protein
MSGRPASGRQLAPESGVTAAGRQAPDEHQIEAQAHPPADFRVDLRHQTEGAARGEGPLEEPGAPAARARRTDQPDEAGRQEQQRAEVAGQRDGNELLRMRQDELARGRGQPVQAEDRERPRRRERRERRQPRGTAAGHRNQSSERRSLRLVSTRVPA